MANAEMAAALQENAEIIRLRPATEVISLEDIPGKEATLVRNNGWQKAYFRGGLDSELGAFYAKLTLVKPLARVEPNPLFTSLPESIRQKIDREISASIVGDTNTHGVSRLPTLMARIDDRDGDIGLTVCTTGVLEDYYNRDNPAGAAGNERLANTIPFMSPEQATAIHGLYSVIAETSDAILTDRIR